VTSKDTVQAYWRAWSEHKPDDLFTLLAPDFVSRSSLSQGRPVTREMIVKGFRMFAVALPDLKDEVVSMVAEGDRVVCEVVETATFTGPMELPSGAVPPTNRSYRIPVGSFFRVNPEGLIAEVRTYWDTADWERQIGMDPTLFAPTPPRHRRQPHIPDEPGTEFCSSCLGDGRSPAPWPRTGPRSSIPVKGRFIPS
jgi:steroid delta-isomerase-like uncharacterized protein